jgi:hypothetical protein
LIQIIHVFLINSANFILQTTALLSHKSALLLPGLAFLGFPFVESRAAGSTFYGGPAAFESFRTFAITFTAVSASLPRLLNIDTYFLKMLQ